jgi:ABC-2 type transport system permease protein
MMKAISVARKSLLELVREPMLFWLLLLFPAVMVGFYYVAFGRTKEGLATYLTVLVANEDAGATMADGTRWQAGVELVQVLQQTEYDGDSVFEATLVTDRRAAEIALRERKAAMLLAIPADFSQSLVDGLSGVEGASPAVIILEGDPNSETFVFAKSFLNWLIPQFAKEAGGWGEDILTIDYEFLPGTGTMSDFDWGVGGLVVFGVMFLMITTATVMVREDVAGTLRRLKLTRLNAASLLLGVTLAQMVAAAVQMPITFGTAVAMGFDNNGSLLLAMVVGLLLSLSAIGLGLIVACFARNDGEAANLASGLLVPAVFLSGAVFPMPDVPLVTVGERTIQAYDLIPATHAGEAMRRILILGEGVNDILYELTMMTVLSVILLVVGIALYHKLKLRGV